MPRLDYDSARKLFSIADAPSGAALHSGPQSKVSMLRDRFLLVQQRLQRNEMFCKPLIASTNRDYIELSTIDTLLGSQGGVKWLLGMLCEVEEGSFYLEDMNAHVPLDLSGAVTTPGMFTENCIVLTEGEMVDGQFRVKIMGFPPPQQRTESLEAIGTFDLFRTGITPQNWAKMQELEQQANDDMFVIVSDVHLDRPQVLEKLREMFEGFSGMPQLPLFVLIGDFTSRPVSFGKDGVQQLLGHFRNLANLIAEFPLLAEEGRFVFVPGPRDPGAGNTLPRPPLASKFTSYLQEKVPHASFATNPCRLRFYAQEITIFREDILKKMQRHCIFAPRSDEREMDVTEHVRARAVASVCAATQPPLWCSPNNPHASTSLLTSSSRFTCFFFSIISAREDNLRPGTLVPASSHVASDSLAVRPRAEALSHARRGDPRRPHGPVQLEVRGLPRAQPGLLPHRLFLRRLQALDV